MTTTGVSLTILLLAMLLVSSADAECKRIFLRGLDPAEFPFAQSHEGVYTLYPDQDPQGYPLYIHETEPIVLQVHSEEYMLFRPSDDANNPRLMVRIKPGYNIASWLRLQGQRRHKHPFRKIVDAWMFHDDTTDRFRYLKADIQIECADDDMYRCSADVYRFSHSVSRRVDGDIEWAVENDEEFVRADGEYMNLRPVYQSQESGNVLFYAQDGHWVISTSLAADRPIMRVRDSAYLPEYISAFWEVAYRYLGAARWKVRRHLRLVCAVSIADVLGTLSSWCFDGINPCHHGGSCFSREHSREEFSYCLCPRGYSGVLCEQATPKCPRPDLEVLGVQHAAFRGHRENQTIGDIAVMYCNQNEYFTSVCALDTEGNAVWIPDDTGRCPVTTEFDPFSSEFQESVPTIKPESIEWIQTTIEGKKSAPKQEVTTNTPAMTTTVQTERTTESSQTVGSTKETTNCSMNSTSSISAQLHHLSQTQQIFVGGSFFFILLLFPCYLFTQYHKYKRTSGQNRKHRELHVKTLRDIYNRRDGEVEALQQKYPGLVFSREDGVFVRDNGKFMESQKRDIAAEYHGVYIRCKKDIRETELRHEEDLVKIARRQTLIQLCFVLYWGIVLVASITAYCLAIWDDGWFKTLTIGCTLIAYACLLFEPVFAEDFKNLLRMKKGNVEEYLEALRREQPLLVMAIDVYRQDVKVHVGDNRGLYTTQDKVVVNNHYNAYSYTAWKDTSAEFPHRDARALYNLTMSRKIRFSDEELYEQHCREMQDSYSRPAHCLNFSLITDVEGFAPNVVLCGQEAPWWMKSKALLFVSVLFCCSWLLRSKIRRRTIPAAFTLKKTVFNARENMASDPEVVLYDEQKAAENIVRVVSEHELRRRRQERRNKKRPVEKAPIYRSHEALPC